MDDVGSAEPLDKALSAKLNFRSIQRPNDASGEAVDGRNYWKLKINSWFGWRDFKWFEAVWHSRASEFWSSKFPMQLKFLVGSRMSSNYRIAGTFWWFFLLNFKNPSHRIHVSLQIRMLFQCRSNVIPTWNFQRYSNEYESYDFIMTLGAKFQKKTKINFKFQSNGSSYRRAQYAGHCERNSGHECQLIALWFPFWKADPNAHEAGQPFAHFYKNP